VGRRILIICPHFPPGTAPTAWLISEIVEGLGAAGWRIEVVTSVPRRSDRIVGSKWRHRLIHREETEWGRITRVCAFWTTRTALRYRGPAALGFSALCALAGMLSRRRCDVVLAVSSPFVLGFAGWIVARRRRVPFVFNVQDALTDVVNASEVVSGIGSETLSTRLLPGVERFVYRSSQAVTVLSEDMAAKVRAKLGPAGHAPGASSGRRLGRPRKATQVRVIPNFVDADFIVPMAKPNSYRDEFGLVDKTVVMYAGNVGLSQPLELMIEAAESFAERDDVVFVVNGDGSTWDRYATRAAGVDNLVLVPHQKTERLPEVLAAADIHVVLLRRGLTGSSMPSKIYSALAAARPMVASIDADSEPARLLADNDCGLVVAPEASDAFAAALAELIDDPQRCQEMGERGRSLVESLPTAAEVGAAYGALFAELLGEPVAAGGGRCSLCADRLQRADRALGNRARTRCAAL